MYVSMTGFGRASAEREWGKISLELSSVNHRYQEISVRLPRELASLEPWFHQRSRGLFRRGKLQARVEIAWAASANAVAINKEALMSYYKEISSLRNSMGVERDISLDTLVSLPGVLDASGRESLGEDAIDMLSELLDSAAENWNRMRRDEGAHLKEAIDGHIAEVERNMSEIGKIWPGTKDAAFETMMARVAKTLEAIGVSADESRFAQEAVIFADKWDITEEVSRMESHIAKFREIGLGGESEGRKLDFLVQEMNREANTINSKSRVVKDAVDNSRGQGSDRADTGTDTESRIDYRGGQQNGFSSRSHRFRQYGGGRQGRRHNKPVERPSEASPRGSQDRWIARGRHAGAKDAGRPDNGQQACRYFRHPA